MAASVQENKFENGLDIVKQLCENGAMVDSKDEDRNTPLHLAALSGNLKVVQYLIKKGANINAKDIDKWTALHFAAASGHKDIVNLLAYNNGNTKAKNNVGCTPQDVAMVGLTVPNFSFIGESIEM